MIEDRYWREGEKKLKLAKREEEEKRGSQVQVKSGGVRCLLDLEGTRRQVRRYANG